MFIYIYILSYYICIYKWLLGCCLTPIGQYTSRIFITWKSGQANSKTLKLGCTYGQKIRLSQEKEDIRERVGNICLSVDHQWQPHGRIVYLVCPAQVADAPFGRVAPHSRKTIRDLFIYFVIPWGTNLLYIGENIHWDYREEFEDTKGVIRIHWDY